jgi:hypothetical protein
VKYAAAVEAEAIRLTNVESVMVVETKVRKIQFDVQSQESQYPGNGGMQGSINNIIEMRIGNVNTHVVADTMNPMKYGN